MDGPGDGVTARPQAGVWAVGVGVRGGKVICSWDQG